MTVNETVIALIRPKPDLDLVAGEPAAAVAAAQAAAEVSKGIGSITSYATEIVGCALRSEGCHAATFPSLLVNGGHGRSTW
ncbi:hypothetical protein OG758_48150 [Streptomyces sp. NBC_01474]|nr:hypothetical protein [Streptomyces sp. NBC_01474]WSE01201.1 hypothetical protein OG758_48150 [Streptomyces sp. NBC_01474]